MRTLFLAGALALALAGCGRSPPPQDAPVVAAAERFALACGQAPFHAEAAAEDIEALYGEGALTEELILEEGLESPGALLFAGDPERELAIVWMDPDARAGIVKVFTSGAAWTGPAGVKVGAAIAEVERANGAAFSLAGFGWDRGGVTLDWRGGTLAAADGCRVVARFRPGAEAPLGVAAPMGDAAFASDAPAMQAVAPVVASLEINYEEAVPAGE